MLDSRCHDSPAYDEHYQSHNEIVGPEGEYVSNILAVNEGNIILPLESSFAMPENDTEDNR